MAINERVLLNGRALAFQVKDTGSIPVARFGCFQEALLSGISIIGPIAQWLEQPAQRQIQLNSKAHALNMLLCRGLPEEKCSGDTCQIRGSLSHAPRGRETVIPSQAHPGKV